MDVSGQRGPARPRTVALTLALTLALPGCAAYNKFLHPGAMSAPAPIADQAEPPQVVEPPMPTAMAEQPPQMAMPSEMASAMSRMAPRPRATMPPARPRTAPRPPATPASIVPPALTVQPIAPATLVGFSFDSVLEVLRMPDTVEKNALSVVWTYAEADCTLQLYFYPDIQTTIFHVLKYDLKSAKGEKLSDTGACMQPLMAMRKDGAQPTRPAERTDSDRR